MTTTKKTALFLSSALAGMTLAASLSFAGGDYRGVLDWSIGDTGAPDCPQDYQYPECLLPGAGNRSCLMRKAIQSAKDNDCANAMRQALTTQCHNGNAQTILADAGQQAVCDYLKSK